MRGLGRWRRPNPEAKSASLSRAADLYLDRDELHHESHNKNHKLILLSASFEIARATTRAFRLKPLCSIQNLPDLYSAEARR